MVGERNMKLHRLAVNLRYICDNSKELLLRVIPNYGLSDEELSRLVESATTHALMPYLPKKLQKALNRAREELHKEQPTDEEQADDSLFDTPPALPRRLPPMIELLVSKTPPSTGRRWLMPSSRRWRHTSVKPVFAISTTCGTRRRSCPYWWADQVPARAA